MPHPAYPKLNGTSRLALAVYHYACADYLEKSLAQLQAVSHERVWSYLDSSIPASIAEAYHLGMWNQLLVHAFGNNNSPIPPEFSTLFADSDLPLPF